MLPFTEKFIKNILTTIFSRLKTSELPGIYCLGIFLFFNLNLLIPNNITVEAYPKNIGEQTIVLKGTVLDKTTNSPIPYAHISFVDTKLNMQTDLNGIFSILLKPGQANGKIRIMSLGYSPQEFIIADLIKQSSLTTSLSLFLAPDYKNLKEIEVNAKAKTWKVKKIGYHIDEGAPFHYEFFPSDTLTGKATGQEIGARIQLGKYPAFLRSVSFGLAGLSEKEIKISVHLYSLKNNLPYLNLLPKPAIIALPSHHAGWISVNLQEYNLKLKEDFAIVVEWLETSGEQNRLTLMDFANIPKGQLIYIRSSAQKPWKVVKSSLIDINSIGMYASVVYEK